MDAPGRTWNRPCRADGSRNFNRLTGLLELPVQLAQGKVADKFVYHLAVRCAPDDPDLGDGAWNAIATEVMHRTGLSVRGREDQGVCWVAVHHGDNHIHIVATLARQDRRPVLAEERLLPDRRGAARHRARVRAAACWPGRTGPPRKR